MDTQPQLPSDGQLVVAARSGLVEAWNELLRRHGAATADVAKARRRRRSKKRAQASLSTLHASIVADEIVPDGLPSVRAFRPRAISTLTGAQYGPDLSEGLATAAESTMATADATPGSAKQDRSELQSLANAFSLLPELWQTALWHRSVELQPAASFASLLGRSADEAGAVVRRAEVGLFEGFLLDQASANDESSDSDGPIAQDCAPVVPLLGGFLRSTLSAHQQRLVEDHLDAGLNGGDAEPGCGACQRRLVVNDKLMSLIPVAIVPSLTGLNVERYRAAVGAKPQPVGIAAIDEQRTDRARKFAFLGAFAALLLAVVAAMVLIKDPFDGIAFPPDSAFDHPSTSQPVTDQTSTIPPATTEPGNDPDASATTTTDLVLRPPATGPENRTELIFAQGTRAVGFASAPPDFTVELSSLAPVFAGGTGTIDVTISNSGNEPVEANFAIRVPSGVLFDGLTEGVADCTKPVDDSAFCNVAVPAGQTSMLALRFRLASATVGRFVVDTNTNSPTLEVQISAIHRLVHSSVGRGEIVMIGNTLMTCDESELACFDARDGVGDIVNRWDLSMRFVDANPLLGWSNSSVAVLDIGDAEVEAAYLFWSGDLKERGVEISDEGSAAIVSLMAPNSSEPVAIQAERVRVGDIDATQYLGFADVTSIVRESGAGDYVVGDVRSVEVQGSYAGWSLVVITADQALPRRELVLISPFAWFSPADTYSQIIPVPPSNGRAASIGVLAFEGERGFVPEQLSAGQVALGDDRAFDSSIKNARDPQFANNFGIGIDAYDLDIDAPDGTLAIEATSGKDGIRLAVYGLAVDLE